MESQPALRATSGREGLWAAGPLGRRLAVVGVLALLGLCLLAVLLAADLYAGLRDHRGFEGNYRDAGTDYLPAFYSASGGKLGHRLGRLAMIHKPFVHYAHRPSQRTASFSINSRGYRGPELREPKRGLRIVVLGGSTAFGWGLRSDQGDFARSLEKLSGAEVVNTAVPGWVSGQELVLLATEVLDLEPDLVLALDGANDFIYRFGPLPALGGGYFFHESDLALAGAYELTKRGPMTRLLHLDRVLVPRLSDRLRRSSRVLASPEQAAEVYSRNLARMSRLAAGQGAGFLALFQPVEPAFLPPDPDPAFLGYEAFRARSRSAFAAYGVPFVDLNEPAHLERLRPHFFDPVHLREGGHRELARLVAARIRASGLLRPRARRERARP